MGDVIYLDPVSARTISMLKGSIAWDKIRNKDGKFDRSIQKQKVVLRSLMDEVLGREAA